MREAGGRRRAVRDASTSAADMAPAAASSEGGVRSAQKDAECPTHSAGHAAAKGLKSAQLLGQPGVLLTSALAASASARSAAAAASRALASRMACWSSAPRCCSAGVLSPGGTFFKIEAVTREFGVDLVQIWCGW